jgi:hypothetical protein
MAVLLQQLQELINGPLVHQQDLWMGWAWDPGKQQQHQPDIHPGQWGRQQRCLRTFTPLLVIIMLQHLCTCLRLQLQLLVGSQQGAKGEMIMAKQGVRGVWQVGVQQLWLRPQQRGALLVWVGWLLQQLQQAKAISYILAQCCCTQCSCRVGHPRTQYSWP